MQWWHATLSMALFWDREVSWPTNMSVLERPQEIIKNSFVYYCKVSGRHQGIKANLPVSFIEECVVKVL